AMAEFFEKLAKEHKGTKTEQFFSNHPIPENRVAKVNAEIEKLGRVPAQPRLDSPDCQEEKRIMLAYAEPVKRDPKAGTSNTSNSRPPSPPSSRVVEFNSGGVRLRHPDNWKSSVQGAHVTIAPENGAINGNLAYGMLIDTFQTRSANLEQATSDLLN